MKYLFLLLGFLLISSCGTEKATTLIPWEYHPEKIVLDTRFPIEWVIRTEGNKETREGLSVKHAKLQVTVSGRIAHFRMSLELVNPLNRELEGEFSFPLPPGSQVNHLALDINGKMRQGVIVEKEKGRVVFEEISRQNDDPALLEKTDENLYRLRVFPVPAGGSRKIEIGFDQSLDLQGNGYIFWYPYQMSPILDELKMDIHILGMETPPSLEVPAAIRPYPIQFKKSETGYSGSFVLKPMEKASVYFALNPVENLAVPLRTKLNDELDLFSLPIALSIKERNRQAPSRVLLLWDASSSVREEDRNKQIQFLKGYNERFPLTHYTLQVQQFPKPKSLTFEKGTELLAYLEDLNYDGASVFYLPESLNVQEIWYFSDGKINMTTFPQSLPAPLYSISAGITANTSFLKQLAEGSGGSFIVLGEKDEESIADLLTDHPRLIEAEGVQSEQIHPSLNSPVFENQWIYLPIPKSSRKCKLVYGYKDGERETLEYDLPDDAEEDRGILSRQWASSRIVQLESRKSKGYDTEIRTLSQRFHLVSAQNSLLVLDSLLDYVRFNVEPEEPDLKEAYFARLRDQEVVQSEDQDLHDKQIRASYLENRKLYLADYQAQNEDVLPDPPTPMVPETLPLQAPLAIGTDSINVADSGAVILDADEYTIEADLNLRYQTTIRAEGNGIISFSHNFSSWGNNIGYLDETMPIANSLPLFGTSRLKMKPFDPGTPEYKKWKKMGVKELYAAYLLEKDILSSPPAFYLDISELLIRKGDREKGLRVISNLAEMQVESAELLRILGRRLMKEKSYNDAVFIFEHVRSIKGEDPQSYRDLALALEADKQYQRAFNTFCYIVHTNWDERFPEIELIAIEEAQHVWNLAKKELNTDSLPVLYREIIPKKLRIVVDWDTDLCDIDLWVDQDGERCYYGNRFASDGGILSRDFTGGYGPEVYQITKPQKGSKEIRINYFGERANKVLGETLIHVKIFRNYGTKYEKMSEQTLRLASKGATVDIAEIDF